MSNFIARTADAITPALIAFPIAIMLSTAAHAESVKVKVGDLDLASRGGQAVLAQRVDVAAQNFCRSEKMLSVKAGCRAGVREEVQEKLAMVSPTSIGASAIAAR